MIRKFCAVVFILCFVFIMPPLLILESVTQSFFNEKSVAHNVIPQSYDAVIAALAENVAVHQSDSVLFKQRISAILPQAVYNEIMRAAVHPLFENIEQFEKNKRTVIISAITLKSILREKAPELLQRFPPCDPGELRSEEFRFCIPPNTAAAVQMKSIINQFIDKIPDTLKLPLEKQRPEIARALSEILLARRYLPFIIAAVAFVLLGIVALFIFSPLKSVLKWVSLPLIFLSMLMTLFIISVYRLLQKPELLQDIPQAQQDFIRVLVQSPLQLLTQWVFVIIILGTFLLTVSLLKRV